jgi:thiol:disulfide interchange protein
MMRTAAFLLVLLVGGLPPCVGTLTGQDTAISDSIYSVAVYDPSRDPVADLQLTIERAEAEGKRILLEIGGTWCIDCRLLDLFIEGNAAVAQTLQENFVVLKVNVNPENENEAFLSEYPEIEWYPHIFVLESDGSFLHSQDTRELQDNRIFRGTPFLQFLDDWTPGEGG